MEYVELKQITRKWETMTSAVLNLEKFSLAEMQTLLKDTYQALRRFHKDELIPKEISKILLEMDGFLYFASLEENKEVGIDFYHYRYISAIVDGLKKGFFEAEYDCDFPNLKILDAEKNVVVINFESDIFLSSEFLRKINGTSDFRIENTDLVKYIGPGGDVVIPDGVTCIRRKAFCDCKELTGVTIPDSVSRIEDFAFSCCERLTDITIPDSVTEIGQCAFHCCYNLKNARISHSVTKIGHAAFLHCDSLTSIIIPDGVTSIESEAFFFCWRLENVTIPSSVTRIGYLAFSWCTSLTGITIPNGVTGIEEEAFSDCTNLTEITIPDSVTKIAKNAFYRCNSLTIHAPAGSYAEKYAKENNIPFVAE